MQSWLDMLNFASCTVRTILSLLTECFQNYTKTVFQSNLIRTKQE